MVAVAPRAFRLQAASRNPVVRSPSPYIDYGGTFVFEACPGYYYYWWNAEVDEYPAFEAYLQIIDRDVLLGLMLFRCRPRPGKGGNSLWGGAVRRVLRTPECTKGEGFEYLNGWPSNSALPSSGW